MGKDNDGIGDRMKTYEAPFSMRTVPRVPIVIRLDGCHFHSFTRGFVKPFDSVMEQTMKDTMGQLCAQVQNCVFGFTQSDEITLVLRMPDLINSQEYYDGRVQKIVSITASKCTRLFNKTLEENITELCSYPSRFPDHADPGVYKRKLSNAEFDARVMNIPECDVYNNLIWRQQDATRNSLSMLAQAHFSQKMLQGKKRQDMFDMLMEQGINWNDLSPYRKRGACCYRTYIHGSDHKEWYVDDDTIVFTTEEARMKYQPIVEGTETDSQEEER